MLSRLAESYFWMGRYIERAEGTTRLLVEFHQLLVQEQGSDQNVGVAVLVNGLGIEEVPVNIEGLVRCVYGDADAANSIVGALNAARNNARSIRDALPPDFFEALNKAYLRTLLLPDIHFPGAILREILEGLAGVNGVFHWVAPRDEAMAFFRLGCYLERIDLVGRLLNMRIDQLWPEQGSATMLRSVGGLSTYLRNNVRLTGANVRIFLTTDVGFPRSLLHSAQEASSTIRDIAHLSSTNVDDVIHSIGLLKSQLEYSQFTGDMNALNEKVDMLVAQSLRAVETTSVAVKNKYFRPIGSIVWSH